MKICPAMRKVSENVQFINKVEVKRFIIFFIQCRNATQKITAASQTADQAGIS
jgi:hypothetical protein